MKTPIINVNLAPCTKRCHEAFKDGGHYDNCASRPVLIPCPIQRSVVMEVRLGECIDDGREQGSAIPRACAPNGPHHENCPARPIRVACDIVGETWAESEVVDVKIRPRETLAMASTYDMQRILAACRARWEIVAWLVTGKRAPHERTKWSGPTLTPFEQRDTVFAALAAKVRSEREDDETTRALVKALPNLKFSDMATCTADDYLSARALRQYVAGLIEQVGVL